MALYIRFDAFIPGFFKAVGGPKAFPLSLINDFVDETVVRFGGAGVSDPESKTEITSWWLSRGYNTHVDQVVHVFGFIESDQFLDGGEQHLLSWKRRFDTIIGNNMTLIFYHSLQLMEG